MAHLGPNLQFPWKKSDENNRWIGTATNLREIFTHIVHCGCEIMAERARLASLTRALPKELARNMGGICINTISTLPRSYFDILKPTLFTGRTSWALKPRSLWDRAHHLRLSVARSILRSQAIRDVETAGAHVSIGRIVIHPVISIDTAVSHMWMRAVAQHTCLIFGGVDCPHSEGRGLVRRNCKGKR